MSKTILCSTTLIMSISFLATAPAKPKLITPLNSKSLSVPMLGHWMVGMDVRAFLDGKDHLGEMAEMA
jgi:hypothetical protein